MIYTINKDLNIDSSRTAKSYLQQSCRVVDFIRSFEFVDSILDYGCGKLRYSLELRDKCDNLSLLDSNVQLNRVQMIHNTKISVKEYISKNYPDIKIISTDEICNVEDKFNIIFCSNVLSAIPDYKIRSNLLYQIYSKLKDDGKAYFITQYTNSFYSKLSKRDNVIQHLDGFISKNGSKSTYYGILGKDKLTELLEKHGFNVIKVWNVDQSTYAEVTR